MFAPDLNKHTSRSVPSQSLSFLRRRWTHLSLGVCTAPRTLWL